MKLIKKNGSQQINVILCNPIIKAPKPTIASSIKHQASNFKHQASSIKRYALRLNCFFYPCKKPVRNYI
jgi:hypothetical protein